MKFQYLPVLIAVGTATLTYPYAYDQYDLSVQNLDPECQADSQCVAYYQTYAIPDLRNLKNDIYNNVAKWG